MSIRIADKPEVRALLDQAAGLDQSGGDARLKAFTRRLLGDLFAAIDEFDVSEDEFWRAIHFLGEAAPEFGLWVPGLGLERFLDMRMDATDKAAGVPDGTPRTIEGPLYIAGAPLSKARARLDDGTDLGDALIMQGRVRGLDGAPIAGAIVDVWHANTRGGYSHFDPSQSAYNNRRRIETDADGAYWFRSILPSGYAVPPGGTTERLLNHLGRHGHRPAHIHFFVSAPGWRHLTTQINIAGDPYLHDDFAYATRDELIPPLERIEDPERIRAAGLNEPYVAIAFDFVLSPADASKAEQPSSRPRNIAA